MKKTIILLGVLFAASTVFTQGAYATFGLGYAGSNASYELGNERIYSGGTWTESSISGGYGTGIPINLSGGYMLNKNVGIELGLSYFLGSTITANKDIDVTNNETSISTAKYSSFRVSPMLVLSTGGEGLSLYTKLGIVLPLTGKTAIISEETNTATNVVIDIHEAEAKSKISLGYTASIGVAFPITEKLSIFGEVQMINLRDKWASYTITKIETGGVDQLAGFTKDQIETEFVDEVKSTDNQNSNEAYKELAPSFSVSSLGLNVGIKMKF